MVCVYFLRCALMSFTVCLFVCLLLLLLLALLELLVFFVCFGFYIIISYPLFNSKSRGSGDGKVLRVLASHQCGPGSIPGLGVICGLSLLVVLVLAPRGFPLSSKNNVSTLPIRPGKCHQNVSELNTLTLK